MILSLWQIKQEREEKVWSREKRVENPIEREENIERCEERKKERKIPPSIRFFPSRAIGSLPSVDNWRSVSWLGFAKPVSLTLVDPSLTSSSIDSKGSSSNRSFPESYYSFQLKLSILRSSRIRTKTTSNRKLYLIGRAWNKESRRNSFERSFLNFSFSTRIFLFFQRDSYFEHG